MSVASDFTSLRNGLRLCRQTHPQLRVTQLEFLVTVALHPGSTQTELARECEVELPTISRAVDVFSTSGRRDNKSVAFGFVESRTSEHDHRIRQIFLTPAGKEFLSLFTALTYTAPGVPQ